MLILLAALSLAGCSSLTAGSEPNILIAPLNEEGLLAGELGSSLNASARRKAAEAEYRALESGQTGMPVPWKMSDNLYGNVVPQQPYSVGSSNCRRYVHTVTEKGQVRSATGTACRNDEGIWQPLS